MKINGINGANIQMGGINMMQSNDSVSKNLQNQIANAQKQIMDLNNRLRQHQLEQRKEQQVKKNSMDDMLGTSKKTAPKTGKHSTGLSQASMKAMISADSAMAQAQIQGSVATRMEGRAGVLESEIKLDSARGGDAEAKKEELAEVEKKAVQAESAQMNTLAAANKELEEAAKADQQTEKADEKTDEKAEDKDKKTVNMDIEEPAEVSVSETVAYTHVDVLL